MASAHKAWVFLVVDDHPINRLLLRKVLASHWPQAHIVEATHGAEALAYVQAHTVHAVFMDMLMPVMNGIEATRAIRALPQTTARTVIVGLTANVNAEDLATFKGAGLDSLMLKPFNLAQLCTDIDQLLTLRW
jgi:CheY-like chemotaxis protein